MPILFMNCAEIQDYLAAFVDGELGLWKKWQIALHLKMCTACEKAAEIQRRIKWLLKSRIHKQSAPQDLYETLRQSLSEFRSFHSVKKACYSAQPQKSYIRSVTI